MLLTRTRLILEREWLRRAVSGLQAERRLRAEQNADDLRTAETLRKRVQAMQKQLEAATSQATSLQQQLDAKEEELSATKRKVTSLTWRVVQLSGDKAPKAAPVMSSLVDQAEIAELQRKLTKAVETPIQAITRCVSELVRGDEVDRETLQKSLLSILSSLSTSDLYRPVFSRLFTDFKLDSTTRQWVSDQFGPHQQQQQGDKAPPTAGADGAGAGDEQPTFAPVADAGVLKGWDFNVFGFTEDNMLSLLESMFIEFNIPVETLRNFLTHCRRAYRKNPYHSFLHAFDVTQTLYLVLTKTEVMHYLTKLDVFALLVAGLCHDLDHPGTNNLFQVNAQTPLALVYNDMSALENYHASHTFTILQKPRCNILENLTPAEYREMRKSIIAMILATDLSAHFTTLTRFTTHTETAPFSRDSPDDRQLLLDILLHAADISNPSKPWPIAKRWSELNAREFFEQGDMERKKGLPVSPYMDRGSSTAARFQVSLIDYCISPTFAAPDQAPPGAPGPAPPPAARRPAAPPPRRPAPAFALPACPVGWPCRPCLAPF
ncbi:putative 3'; 5'-cyclic-nucleotide phosphodiesterase regA [Paratrimastix pyriformis]|uniref:Phosphodiesterase n=1 Tax=Paratrimastix pyriformis TaxID=342808 RepID=A0ABQ8UKL6_9EUKA|nr:putative 3'; 5'-cyclic-nucleotide phosphodiesterase regA [Paratrimastix pyriformis]